MVSRFLSGNYWITWWWHKADTLEVVNFMLEKGAEVTVLDGEKTISSRTDR